MLNRLQLCKNTQPTDPCNMEPCIFICHTCEMNLMQTHKEIDKKHIYDHQSPLKIGSTYKHQLSPVTAEKLLVLCLLLKLNLETSLTNYSIHTRQHYNQCERGKKCSKCVCIQVRLRASSTRSALPTLNSQMLARWKINRTRIYTAWGKRLLSVCLH